MLMIMGLGNADGRKDARLLHEVVLAIKMSSCDRVWCLQSHIATGRSVPLSDTDGKQRPNNRAFIRRGKTYWLALHQQNAQ